VDIVANNIVGVGFPDLASEGYDAFRTFNKHLVLFYILDDYFEQTINLKEDLKLIGNDVSLMELFSQFLAVYQDPFDSELPKLDTTETSAPLYFILCAWKSFVQDMKTINPSYLEHVHYIAELKHFFSNMMGGFKSLKSGNRVNHSEYLYRMIRLVAIYFILIYIYT